MSLIIRIDVDRPFGKRTVFRQSLSRLSSELYFPKLHIFGYLNDLEMILDLLNHLGVNAYIFFRKCTQPTPIILQKIETGDHTIGLHLENSRSFKSFQLELACIEKLVGKRISTFSKHGSGQYKYGLYHYAPYEPEKYIEWGKRTDMLVFFGNNQDPTISDYSDARLHIYPAAFWLESYWRDTKKYTVEWLVQEARKRDIVLLFHPDNVTADQSLFDNLTYILKKVPFKKIAN